MVIILSVIVILIISFLLALRSLASMRMDRELKKVRSELERGRVIFGEGNLRKD